MNELSHLISYYNQVNKIGTMVVIKLENQTMRTIKEVFDMFAPIDEGFTKTRIPIHANPTVLGMVKHVQKS